MKTFQAFLVEADEFYRNPKIIPDEQLQDFVSKNCREALRAMVQAGWLYRGFKNPVVPKEGGHNRTAFALHSPTGRSPLNTAPELNKLFIQLIESLPNYNGVNRDNCFFLTGNKITAQIYGELYKAIPMDGFRFLASNEVRDLYTFFQITVNGLYQTYFRITKTC